jgi:hypothetical protein
MTRSRSYRRHERAKALARATRRAKYYVFRYENDPAEYYHWVRLTAITPHPCSNHCCGNPRRHYTGKEALTMQERRYLDDFSRQD